MPVVLKCDFGFECVKAQICFVTVILLLPFHLLSYKIENIF